ncbi:MAG: cupin domain-containing protein [Gammaproteobacteria bacterium]|nr:MAG: cupin domain-containing protein [Gammaproteobacteria bacterium]
MNPRLIFRDISRSRFIAEYWHKRPLVLRQAIPPAAVALAPDELAGLACEPDIESRLVIHHGGTDWSLRHGPFEEQDFTRLPARDWTLLVQDVDKHLAEVAALLDAFDFVPDWRLDDIMISYAVDGGGVGPHTDNYDVFLIQALGRRRWRLSDGVFGEEDLLPNCPLRILKDFPVDQDLVLEPGDVLYLPPRVGHWGTAVGECMTWSVGMRGPSDLELLAAWIEHLAHRERPHLGDSIAPDSGDPARLTTDDIAHARELLQGCLPGDNPDFRRWLGAHLTEPKPGFEIEPIDPPCSPEMLRAWRREGQSLHRHPWARFALVQPDMESLALCCQGEALTVDPALEPAVTLICRLRHFTLDQLPAPPDTTRLDSLLAELLTRRWLVTDD